jgi:hypothetical protein
MSDQFADFEQRLRLALAPIEPPAGLEPRLEQTLDNLVGLAADELDALELRAMRDPRNWARPAAAVVVGSGAAVGLVLVRASRKRHRRPPARNPLELVGRAVRDISREVRRLADDVR